MMMPAESTGKLWDLFSRGLWTFIMAKVKNEDVAGDLMQEVFIRMHDNLGKLNDTSKIKVWLYQITRNLIIDYFREKKVDAREYRAQMPHGSKQVNFMDEAVTDMIRMMDNLPPEFCEALCLTEIGSMSQKEYAEKAGLSYSGAKSRVQRARGMLKEMLLECCHYQFDKYGTVFNIEPACCRCCSSG